MINVDDAIKIILSKTKVLASEKVDILASLGRVLREEVRSDSDIPAFTNSAMDGYAVIGSDTTGATKESPKVLEVIDNLPAGRVTDKRVGKGQAIRIMTGAPMPDGADSVVMVEDTHSEERMVKVFRDAQPGRNVRKAGEDVKKGESVLDRGTLIQPQDMGMLASIGAKQVAVTRQPRIAILATGDELVGLDDVIGPGKIRNSNSYSLYGQVLRSGGIPVASGVARDERQEIKKKIEEGLKSDMLLISGGVSVGDYDYVKEVLTGLNASIEFWKVAIRPGKPLIFGTINGKPVFGLPGNPVSSMVSFEVFVRPAIFRMLGQGQDPRREVEAVLEEDIKKKKGFRYFLRAKTEWRNAEFRTKTTGPQGSGILKSMVLANSLIILPEEEDSIEKKSRVRVRFFN